MDDLRLVDRIRVKATGLRSGSGALTLGQLNVAEWVGDKDHNFFAIVDLVLHLPKSVTLEDLAEAFALLMARNESLRTKFTLGPEPHQHVALTGEFPVEIYEFDPVAYPQFHALGADDDTRSTISPETKLEGALIERLRETTLNIADDVLARAAVAVRDGRPVAAAMVLSHLIADFRATAVLDRQFTELARDPANRHIGAPTHQPLDQAAAEQEPPSRRRAERSLRFWEANLRWMPQCVYAVPAIAEPGPPLGGWLFSPTTSRVVSRIEARTGTGASQVITAALAAVLALRTDTPRFGFRLIGNNRIGAQLHDYVGTIAQDCLVLVDAAVPTFDDLVRQCATAILRASKLGPYDTVELIAACKVIERERGILMHRDAVLNNLSKHRMDTEHTPEDIAAALLRIMTAPESVMHWWHPPVHQDILTEFRVLQFDEITALGLWTWDTSRLPAPEIEALLRGTERLIVAAAAGNVDMAKVSEVTGLVPVVRDRAAWLRLDSCWVELAEVQRLLDDALAPCAALSHVGTGADGQSSLIAYLAASDRIRTPDQAHTACLGALSRRYTAMTPGWYVICDGAPDDPLDLAAWQRQPVLVAGDGRAIAAD